MLFAWSNLREAVRLEGIAREIECDWNGLHTLMVAFGLNIEILDEPVWKLSHGMRQRFEIAKTLSFSTNLLLFDEALSGVDLVNKRAVYHALDRALGSSARSLLFVTHDLGEVARLADEVWTIRDGRIVAQTAIEQPRGNRISLDGGELLALPAVKMVASSLY